MGCWVIGCVGDTPPSWKGLSAACAAHEPGREACPPHPPCQLVCPPCPLMGAKGWVAVAAAAAILGLVACICWR
eukprot:2537494-Alexandrium_andersonii.AAC.1